MFKLQHLLIIFILACLSLFIIRPVEAADFKSDYQFEYFIAQESGNLATSVNLNIKITNLRSDVYVKKFSINFPKNFLIHNIKAFDDKGEIGADIIISDDKTKVEMEFSDPQIGKGSVNNFFLKFDQDNLFKVNGNVWEVILPTVENNDSGSYSVIVHLPSNTDKKISIAKPSPTRISGNTIFWENPGTRTIYAVFGNKQYYKINLTYHLKNPRVTPVYIDIAFPPDTLYQKVYIDSISPKPVLTYLDEDGNYLGRYLLTPSQEKLVSFSGTVEIFTQPRSELINDTAAKIQKQRRYLLTSNQYWQISDLEKIANLKTASDIYYFVANYLDYNYKRVHAKNVRLGADNILKNPDQAVCVEFTDLFVAIAREKGILAREIQGFGFSNDPQLQPLSLTSDILHSWPEFFDEKRKLWVPVDPTWENTSGIDYWNSFDLNHITFAIHGKNPDYPMSAGMYKTENSKDILVRATAAIPKEKEEIAVNSVNLPKRINDKLIYKTKITFVNSSNVYLWDKVISFETSNLDVSPKRITINVLAPMQKKEFNVEYRASIKNKQDKAKLNIYASDKLLFAGSFNIVPYYYEISLKMSLFIAGIGLFFLTLKLLKKSRLGRKKDQLSS